MFVCCILPQRRLAIRHVKMDPRGGGHGDVRARLEYRRLGHVTALSPLPRPDPKDNETLFDEQWAIDEVLRGMFGLQKQRGG